MKCCDACRKTNAPLAYFEVEIVSHSSMRPSTKPNAKKTARLDSKAQGLAARQEWAAAAQTLLPAAQAEPHNTARWLLIAEWHRRSNDAKAAVRVLREALGLTPHDAGREMVALRQALAEALMEAQAWPECIAACEAVLQVEPAHHIAQEILATALLHSDQIDGAARVMGQLLRLSPRDPLHRLKFATLLHLQGHLGAALQEFERVTEMYPDALFTLEAYEAVEMLDKIQIQQILMRASEEVEFRLNLQRAFEETLSESGFHLSEGGSESLRHIVWDGRPDEDFIVPAPRIH